MDYPDVRIAIGFATCGRAPILVEAIASAERQTQPADHIFVSFPAPSDVSGLHERRGLSLIQSPAGLPRQRNAILDAAKDFDLILFLDDDFFVDQHYVEVVRTVLGGNPDIVVATGTPYADGVKGPGIPPSQALSMIEAGATGQPDTAFDPAPHGYGCNMVIRASVARAHGLRFDERLPLYAWSEDIDFTHRLGTYGRMVKLRGARGVHLGIKSGRSSGRRLGYSQVANPLYLRNKGSYSWRRALGSVGRNLAANCARAVWQEPFIDRRGRLLGNALAFLDLCRGRMRPERVLDL